MRRVRKFAFALLLSLRGEASARQEGALRVHVVRSGGRYHSRMVRPVNDACVKCTRAGCPGGRCPP